MELKDKRQVPLADIDQSELTSIMDLEKDLGDKYYLIAYKKDQ